MLVSLKRPTSQGGVFIVSYMYYIIQGYIYYLYMYHGKRRIVKRGFVTHSASQNPVSDPQLVLKTQSPVITVSH